MPPRARSSKKAELPKAISQLQPSLAAIVFLSPYSTLLNPMHITSHQSHIISFSS